MQRFVAAPGELSDCSSHSSQRPRERETELFEEISSFFFARLAFFAMSRKVDFPNALPEKHDENPFHWEVGVGNPDGEPIIQELKAMKQRMDVLFHESLDKEVSNPETSGVEYENWSPPMDIWETGDEWLLVADLPGVVEENLCIEVADSVLTLSGRRNFAAYSPHASVHASERTIGSFRRAFILPTDARRDHIEAELKRGVLTIKVPKMLGAPGISRKVPVQFE